MTKDRDYELEEIIAEIKNSAGAASDEEAFKGAPVSSGKHLATPKKAPSVSKKTLEKQSYEYDLFEKDEEVKRAEIKKKEEEGARVKPPRPARKPPDVSALFEDENDDEEDEEDEPTRKVKRAKRKRKKKDASRLPYDFANKTYVTPGDAVEALTKRIVSTAFSCAALFVFFAAALYLTLSNAGYLPELDFISLELNPFIHYAVCLCLELLAFFAAWEVTVSGLSRLFLGKPNMDTLVFFTALCSAINTLTLLLSQSGDATPAYTSVSVGLCLISVLTKRRRFVSLRRAYKILQIDTEPAAVKTFGTRRAATAFKTSKDPFPDMDAVSTPDTTEAFSLYYAPLALTVSLALAGVSAFSTGALSDLPRALTVISMMTVTPALVISSSFPGSLVSRRLYSSGSALINRKTVGAVKKCRTAVVCDEDLFPAGSVAVTGLKIGDGFSLEYVYSIAASVLEAVGGGLQAAFEAGARQIFAPRFPVSDVRFFESGGLSATVNGSEVLCGTYSFLMRMGVRVKSDVKLSNCLFFAVDSSFAGVFSLKYYVQAPVYSAFRYLSRSRTTPLLAVRDCNLTQEFIETKFRLRAYSTDYPSMEERAYLSSDGPRDTPPLAILTRSSVFSFSEILIACRKLKKTVSFNLVFSLISSVIGVAIMYFLASNGEYGAASPVNALIYFACWLLPVWFISIVFTAC
ncbi:MAG: hypothetical protein IJS65_01630 [Clostridia bacterium]|nr:hypothetical protein [Clostridia bacterium]